MTNRPLILMTNDDGIDSPGLHAAAEAIVDLGDLLILAPSSQQTGAGRSYPATSDNTIYSTQIPLKGSYHPAYKANVSPAQTVPLALEVLAKRPIALCVSGINFGENLGTGVTISGTVGAAIDAACFGIPSIALSLQTPKKYHHNPSSEIDFSVAAHFTRYFVQQTLSKGHPPNVDLLKIDIPESATKQTPWRTASVSRQRYYDLVHKNTQCRANCPESEETVSRLLRDKAEPNSDVYIFAVEKLVSVVPMTIDLTAPVTLDDVSQFYQREAIASPVVPQPA
ncbi:MAG: 5'/3'-nucleotidase SurE [Anaerolineae bacterium]|nr:5'/3'-nucleotidase SurE [Anaerolineae bacterium]